MAKKQPMTSHPHPKPKDDKDAAEYWFALFQKTFLQDSQLVNYAIIGSFLTEMGDYYETRLAEVQEQLTQCYGLEGNLQPPEGLAMMEDNDRDHPPRHSSSQKKPQASGVSGEPSHDFSL